MTMRLPNHQRSRVFGHGRGWIVLSLMLFAANALGPGLLSARPVDGIGEGTAGRSTALLKAATLPIYETRLHYVGKVWFAITNYGLLGTENGNRVPAKDREVLRINYSPSFEFPGGTRNDYLYAGGVWIGGIVGTDTLVSLPIEGQSIPRNELASFDTITEISNIRGTLNYDPSADAEQQYFARFSDTLILPGIDEVDGRPHRPLNIEISQRSYAWSDNFSRQFVIVEDWIKNIGHRPIDKLVCGIFMDADVFNDNTTDVVAGFLDDVSGFVDFAPDLILRQYFDPLNVAWVADNDGDPVGGTFPLFSARGVVGLRILYAPNMERFSFNWWLTGGGQSQAWGPVRAGARTPAPGGGLGAPVGDRNRYYVLGNGEVDYGQLLSTLDFTAEGWRPPLRGGGCDVADGLDTRQLLSVGPSCEPLFPGDSIPFVYALCAGDRFHVDASRAFNCRSPESFVRSLDVNDLNFAATWAAWIYDTPGYDTDGDGYRGEYRLAECDSFDVFGIGWNCDTVYYTGDLGPLPGPGVGCQDLGGLPDRAGPSAPPCPQAQIDLFLETRPSEIVVRWTGRNTETVRDPLSGEIDFEGYRLYVGRINAPDQYSLVASWDHVDYIRFVYDAEPPGRWIRDGNPIPIEQLRASYGEDFDPMRYSTPSPYTCFRDTVYDANGVFDLRCSYFVPHEGNQENTFEESGITKQNVIQRLGDSLYTDEADTLIYGIYEAHLDKLNPSIGLYVSVTAFDFGDEQLGLDPLESTPGFCYDFAIPVYSAGVVEDSSLKVSVYPNPYKISFDDPQGRRTSYYEQGFEAPEKRGRGEDIDEQDRRIWFVNLPSKATIRIYTLDGDLVRTLEHEWPRTEGSQAFLTDYSSRLGWDLVSRNTQAVVSGIYIYRIDSSVGTQLGKLVIIK